MDFTKKQIKELFEGVDIYDNLTNKLNPICFLFIGIYDFNLFKKQIQHTFFDLNVTMTKLFDQMAFAIFNIDTTYFKEHVKKQLNIMHYEVFSIFLKKPIIKIIANKYENINSEFFHLLISTNNLNMQLIEKYIQNYSEIKIIQSSPKIFLYGFNNYLDLISCYEKLIESEVSWPLCAIPPQFLSNQHNIYSITFTENQKKLPKKLFPVFTPIKSLYYFSFIEKIPNQPNRILNAINIYSIKKINDAQISHRYENNNNNKPNLSKIRTFLGFMNKFQCFQNFQYFIKSNQNFFDAQLLWEDQIEIPIIKHNLFYLEAQSSFLDSSILFSIDYIDSFNFEGLTFFSFDNFENLENAEKIIESSFNNDDYCFENCQMIDKNDFHYYFSENSLSEKLFYIIFQKKSIKTSKIKKNNFFLLLERYTFLKDDLICSLDGEHYIVVGYIYDEIRQYAFLNIQESKFLKQTKRHYPVNENDMIFMEQIISQKVYNRIPLFQPKNQFIYIYFQENKKYKLIEPSNIIRPLFGIRNIADLQQNYYLPNDPNEYTFLGFSNKEDMNNAIKLLSCKFNEINGIVYRFLNDNISFKSKRKTRPNNYSRKIVINNTNKNEFNINNTTNEIIDDKSKSNSENTLIVDTNDYIFIKFIGKGSFGLVNLFENKHTHKKYAVKMKSNSSKNFSDFFQELDFYKKFKFPTIVSLHGYRLHNFEGEPKPIIFLEYMSNGPLSKLIPCPRASKPILQSKKYIIIYGIALAIEFLHSKGVFHRDLKPENILLDDNFYPRICDFGLSLIIENNRNHKKNVIGTPKYMAPEIIKEKDCNSSKVDVYSFALIAYEILTGKEAYSEYNNAGKLKYDVIKGVRPDLSFIYDEEILSFFQRCWSSEPSERPDFTEICETLRKPKFKMAFQADELEILKFNYWFNDQLLEFEQSLSTIQKAKKSGDIDKIVEYGNRLFLGIGFHVDKNESFRLFKVGVKHKNVKAMYYLGIYSTNKEQGNKYLKMAADLDYDKAMNEYAKRLSLENKNQEALNYFKKAAQQGNSESLFHLGEIYLNGIGIKIDKKEALKYFLMAAEWGNVQAMYEYAHMLHLDQEIQSDYEKAGEYYKMASFYGNVSSMTNLGLMLKDGKLTVDLKESKHFLKMAAKHDDIDAMFHYGNLLCALAITGECDSTEEALHNFEIASKYFKKAADNGCIEAYTRYGMLYTRGFLKTDDINEPIQYLKYAAYNGSNEGIVEYLAALSNLPFNHKHVLEDMIERTNLMQKFSGSGLDKMRAFALSSGIKVDPLTRFVNNDYCIQNEYDYDNFEEEEEEDKKDCGSKMKKMFKAGKKYGFSHDQMMDMLRIFQNTYNFDDKIIDEVRINHYKAFQFDPDIYYIYFSNFTIPNIIRNAIDKNLKSLSFLTDYKCNLCHFRDPNDIYTFYFFPSHFHNFIQEKISNIFNNFDIHCCFPQSCESVPFTDYLYFDEKLFSSELLTIIKKNLELNQDIIEIKSNIFDGKQIVTVLIVKKGTEKNVIQFIRTFLLQQKVLFKTFVYPLQNNIIINEKMIFNDKNDFNAILKEIKSIDSKIIHVQRNALYLYEFYPLRKLFQRFSFICFQNEFEKMEALNHINSMFFKNKNIKFVEYNIDYFYASFDEHSYPLFIQKMIPDLLSHFKGLKDIQRNVVSIENPVERTYIGFKTLHQLKKCHIKLSEKLKILKICQNSKLFWPKKGLKYLAIKHNCNFDINEVIDIISALTTDIQEKCSELDENQIICISYIGFSLSENIEKAKHLLKCSILKNKYEISINEYDENKYSLNLDEPREAYLFYDSL